MALPITIPSTPSPVNSPSSDESNIPRTPLSPTMSHAEQVQQQQLQQQQQQQSSSQQQQPQQQQQSSSQQSPLSNSNPGSTAPSNNSNGQLKRKPSRRANTAERRATHNAVERQRRETLNGRFLDLAALLPNLSQIRRPSKSSIVNSSIAHIHASRRHRMLAARELRILKNEADALRREVNEWRDRAGIPRIEDPIRGEAFSMVISGELEVVAATPGDEDEEDSPLGYGNYMDEEQDEYISSGPVVVPPGHGMPANGMDDLEDPRMAMLKNANPFTHNMPSQQVHHPHHTSASNGNGLHLAHILPRPTGPGGNSGPMIASPTNVAFDNPAMPALYDSHPYPGAQFIQHQQPHPIHHASLESEKIAAWNAAQMYGGQHHGNQQQILQAQRSLFTPPATSQGPVNGANTGSGASANGSTSGSPSPHASSSSPISTHSPIAGPNPFGDPASQVFFANMQRQQQQMLGQQQSLSYGSPERDDASSVGSNHGHRDREREREQRFRDKNSISVAVSSLRERSASLSVTMGGGQGSGQAMSHNGASPSYELGTGGHGDYSVNVSRRTSAPPGGIWGRDGDMTMGGMSVGMGMGVGVGLSPVAVGGGNGGGFAMMM